jgi:hypothetical protein
MTMRSVPLSVAVALAAVLTLGACNRHGDTRPQQGGDLDTTNAASVDGMSDEQLKEQAKAVSPEQARAMGISDTAAMPGSGEEVSDSTSSPAAKPGSATATAASADSAGAAPTAAVPAKPAARRDRP